MERVRMTASLDKKAPSNGESLAALLFLICGVESLLLFLQNVDGVSYAGWLACPAAAACCTALWASLRRSRKLLAAVLAAMALLCGAAAVFFSDALLPQLLHLAGSLKGEAGQTVLDVTGLAVLLAAALSMLVFGLECLVQSHWALYLLTTALLLGSPFLGVPVTAASLLLTVLFQAGFWTLHTLERRGKKRLAAKGGSRIAKKSSIAVAVLLAVSFAAVCPAAMYFSEELYAAVYEAEGFVYRTLGSLSGMAEQPITGGQVSRGNNYRTGTPHLELTAWPRPAETLYLRGFSGGEYIGGSWEPAEETPLFRNVEETLHWQEWNYMIPGMYQSMYFFMNRASNWDAQAITLAVQHSGGEYPTVYLPYYSQRQGSRYTESTGFGGYFCQYFELSAMQIDWERQDGGYFDWYRELRDAYTQQVQAFYTRVPEEILPRLTKLAAENPLTDLDEITAFILYTLHSNASYTLTPGWAPLNEDIVEYFLFENRSGYCVHFASAATLLYRLYGIPARYAAGYAVQPSDFTVREDGAWTATVTDESAHAWVEIYLPDYGWTPVEVTPASDGSTVASYPGFDGDMLAGLLDAHNWDMAVPSLAETAAAGEEGGSQAAEADFLPRLSLNWEEYRGAVLAAAACLIELLVLLPLLLDYRRLRKLRAMERMNCRMIFGRLLEMLRFCGVLDGYDGSEPDFPAQLAAALPSVAAEEISRLLEAVRNAAYGPEDPDAAAADFARRFYFRAAGDLCSRMPLDRRLRFKYWKAFL